MEKITYKERFNVYKFKIKDICSKTKFLTKLSNYKVNRNNEYNYCSATKRNRLLLEKMGCYLPLENNLLKTPFEYQFEGIYKISKFNGRCLLADQMGLGKTIQAIGYNETLKEKKPALIVAPAFLLLNWLQELKACVGSHIKILLLNSKIPKNYLLREGHKYDYIMVSYTSLANKYKEVKLHSRKKKVEIPNSGWVDYLNKLKLKILIADESHFFKNTSSARTKAIKKLSKKIEKLLFLTGTPIENDPMEIFNAVKLLNKDLFPNKIDFGIRYCNGVHNGFGWQYKGCSNAKELHSKLIEHVMIRRLAKKVLPDLPDNKRIVVPVDITNRKQYNYAANNLIKWIKETKGEHKSEAAQRAEQLVRINELKQLIARGKLKSVISWTKEFIANGDKIIIFCIHDEIVQELMKAFGKIAVQLTGRNTQVEKEVAKDKFQNDPNIKILVGNLRSAGTGHNLTAAYATCHIELGWTASVHDQAERRVLRIGQDSKFVFSYYLIATESIEQYISNIIDEKRKMSNLVIDGDGCIEENFSIIAELTRQLKAL